MKTILHGVSGELKAGSITAIMGPTGKALRRQQLFPCSPRVVVRPPHMDSLVVSSIYFVFISTPPPTSSERVHSLCLL